MPSYYDDPHYSCDPYNIQTSYAQYRITEKKMAEFIKEAKAAGIEVRESEFTFPKSKMRDVTVRIGKIVFHKRDPKTYFDMFEIQSGTPHYAVLLKGNEPELAMMAKYTRRGDYIEISHEGETWRWVFVDGKVKEIYPKMVWEDFRKNRKRGDPHDG